ncbi:unnamed protein product, partial [Heterotrigona itama]
AWGKFIQSSQSCCKLGASITIDKQLFPSKARCRFIQYLPNKPDKFSINCTTQHGISFLRK